MSLDIQSKNNTHMEIKSALLSALLLLISTNSFASRFIGINTNEAMHIDSSVPFVDLFRVSQPFNEAPKHLTKGNVSYDRNGWVSNLNGGQAGTYFVRWMPAQALPKGNYTVLYDGKGRLGYAEGARRESHEDGKDIISLHADANNEISASLIIYESDPKDPIRNIRILLPGGICRGNPYRRVNDASQCSGNYSPFAGNSKNIIFNPAYLHFMRDFKTIRFMNMSGITRNPISSWSQRPNLQEATWAGREGRRGVPVEIMVKLANRLGANAWFNMPHRADDNYVRQYANYVKTHLHPNLKAYIEYTNEAWNEVFSQAKYVKSKGVQLHLDPDPKVAGYKYYAKRSREIFQIWEQVFGGTNRLQRVLAGWSGNPSITPILLKSSDIYKFTDVFAIAPYFYASQKEMLQCHNTNDVFKLLSDEGQRYSIKKTIDQIKKHAELIKPYHVKLVAYEGGQHLVYYKAKSLKNHPNPVLIAANRDPRMERAYEQLLRGFRAAGGQLFMAFSSPRANAHWGFWGVKEYIGQANAETPKYRALMKF